MFWSRICSTCHHHIPAVVNSRAALVARLQVSPRISAQQTRAYAPPKVSGKQQKGPALSEDQQDSFVEEDARKLCTHVCINYKNDAEGDGPEIMADTEYPEWLFKLDLETDKELEDLDMEKDGWKYWEKWEQRRQDQIHLHNKLKYKYFWMQESPSIEMLRYNKYKNVDKGHKFHVIPNTCTGLYMKAQLKKIKGKEPHKLWGSIEEPDYLLERNG